MEIETRDRTLLKSYFLKNKIPTESNFAELIDGMLNQKEDGIVKLPNNPLSIEAAGDASSQKKAINFYSSFGDEKPVWSLSLNPRSDPDDPSSARAGFGINDAGGNCRLFIDRDTGNVGIGTIDPKTSKLKIANSTSDFTDIRFSQEGSGQLELVGWRQGWNINAKTNGKHLHINRDAGQSSNVLIGRSGRELFVRGSDGNVGIGTPSPNAKLDVNGLLHVKNLNVDGDIRLEPATIYVNLSHRWAQKNRKFITWEASKNDKHSGFAHLHAPTNYYTNIPALTLAGKGSGSGFIGVGTTRPNIQLHVKGNGHLLSLEGTDHAHIGWYPNGVVAGRKAWMGYRSKNAKDFTIENTMGKVNLSEASDIALKKNIEPAHRILGKVLQIRPVYFHYKTESDTYPKQLGVIGQELQSIFPEMVNNTITDDGQEILGVYYNHFAILSIQAIIEQQEQIETLKSENIMLKTAWRDTDAKIKTLDASVSELKTAFRNFIAT